MNESVSGKGEGRGRLDWRPFTPSLLPNLWSGKVFGAELIVADNDHCNIKKGTKPNGRTN